MFDRKKYKTFAKKQLKNRWGVPVVMTLITVIIMSLFGIPTYVRFFSSSEFSELMYSDNYLENMSSFINILNRSSASPFNTVIQTIAEAILEFAALSVYLKMSRSPDKVTLGNFIEGLNYWLKAILASLWQLLWVTLWSFLFVIPGIVKAIAYSQMYYILLEYKDVNVRKAMKISMIITKGHKGDLFVTYLSFIGWAIVAALTAGIGTLWLEPYIQMTMINAYHSLMKEAIDDGRIKIEDLKKMDKPEELSE